VDEDDLHKEVPHWVYEDSQLTRMWDRIAVQHPELGSTYAAWVAARYTLMMREMDGIIAQGMQVGESGLPVFIEMWDTTFQQCKEHQKNLKDNRIVRNLREARFRPRLQENDAGWGVFDRIS